MYVTYGMFKTMKARRFVVFVFITLHVLQVGLCGIR